MTVTNFRELNAHAGHPVQCVRYADNNVVIECMQCHEILFEFIEPTVEEMREALVSDWYQDCMNDRDALHAILEDRASSYDHQQVREAYYEADLDKE